jgi:hypothetical protein
MRIQRKVCSKLFNMNECISIIYLILCTDLYDFNDGSIPSSFVRQQGNDNNNKRDNFESSHGPPLLGHGPPGRDYSRPPPSAYHGHGPPPHYGHPPPDMRGPPLHGNMEPPPPGFGDVPPPGEERSMRHQQGQHPLDRRPDDRHGPPLNHGPPHGHGPPPGHPGGGPGPFMQPPPGYGPPG